MSQATQDVLETAREAIEGVREWAGEVAETALEKVHPKPKKRSKLPLLLLLLGIGAVVFYVLRNRGAGESPAPDAFGTAVEEERAARNGGRAQLATPTS